VTIGSTLGMTVEKAIMNMAKNIRIAFIYLSFKFIDIKCFEGD